MVLAVSGGRICDSVESERDEGDEASERGESLSKDLVSSTASQNEHPNPNPYPNPNDSRSYLTSSTVSKAVRKSYLSSSTVSKAVRKSTSFSRTDTDGSSTSSAM